MGCFSIPRKIFGRKSLQSSSHRRVVAVPVVPSDHDGEVGFSGQDMAVRKYEWDEIVKLTGNFATLVDSGGFSSVYLDDRKRAIKTHLESYFRHNIFLRELAVLLHLRHPYIVTLLGYCDDQDRGALVFEFFPNGNLHEYLHGGGGGTLPWRRRIAIAFQLAQALEHLHETCEPHIVHGDIKASNILLDENLNCKLCDFGSAKTGFSSSVRTQFAKMLTISPGYTDPHYLRTGLTTNKNDIYSYGVVLLELLTGAEAFCSTSNRPLTSQLSSVLKDAQACKIEEVMDPKLMADSPPSSAELQEARLILSLAANCLHESPTLRPSATQISSTILQGISFLVSQTLKSYSPPCKTLLL